MTTMKPKRWGLYAAIGLFVLLAIIALAMVAGARVLKGQVEAALGPESEIGEIRLRWDAVEVLGLRLKAPPEKGGKAAWPTEDTLRAKRIVIEPDLLSLLSGKVRIGSIVVEDGYVSALRTADGKLRVVPSLLEKKPEATAAAPPAIDIGRIALKNGAMTFYDATLPGKKSAVCGTPRTAQRRGHRHRAAGPGGEIAAAARRRGQGSAQRRQPADRRLDALRQQGFRNRQQAAQRRPGRAATLSASPPPTPASSAARSTSTCSRRSRTTACARRAASPSSSSSSTAAAAPSWACRARPRSA